MSIQPIGNTNKKTLTTMPFSDKGLNKVSVFLSEEDKNELIELLKFMEGFKRKVMLLLK